jgi:hypothetical protein
MNLVDVDIIRSKTSQRIVDLLHDLGAARISIDRAAAPSQTRLGGYDGMPAPALESDADDALGQTEAVHRRGIDQIDPPIESGADGRNRSGYVDFLTTTQGRRAERHSGDLELRLGNIHEFGFRGRDFGAVTAVSRSLKKTTRLALHQ